MNTHVNLYVGAQLAQYGFPHGHPFGPTRHDTFWNEIQKRGLHLKAKIQDPQKASAEMLELFHTPAYITRVETLSLQGSGALDHGDTPAYPGLFEAASYVVGSAVHAADQIMNGQCRYAFIPIAGLHHAHPGQASGFCVFNDCGVVINHLLKNHQLKTVAYIDIDAHHGDGVFYGFEENPQLIFADIHQDGRFIFPGTGHHNEQGKGEAVGKKLNIPLPPGADDQQFFQKWQTIEEFLIPLQPDFILLQCGADSIKHDPLAQLQFSPAAHIHAATRLCALANQWGHNRVLAVGGGGYNHTNIANAWCGVTRALIKAAAQA
ncbi:acetoin utilization protein AcuC [Magnetococcales bacterium HHB-1]